VPRVLRVAAPATLVAAALCALLLALAFGGGAAAPALEDPGAFVRFGLPVARTIFDLSAAGVVGALILACVALSPQKPEYNRALDVAAASAAVMTVSAAFTGFLTFLSVSGIPLSADQEFNAALVAFFTSISLGQAWLITTLAAAVLTIGCFAVRNQTALAFVTALSVFALIPLGQQGHAAGTAGHDAATTALSLHLIFAALWLGGLVTIVLLKRSLDAGRLVPVVTRYSTLALICFIVVAASGYVSAELRIGTLQNLISPYGILVLVKVAALVALGVFGVLQRRYLIGRLEKTETRSAFWWLVTAELAFMGIASGVAVALSFTATPVQATISSSPTPAEILTGEPLPPPVSLLRYLTSWNIDLIWLLACGFGIFFYIAGVRRLALRGDRWPMHRTVLWVAGMLLLFWVTSGGINVYEKYLFSAHMLGHMILAMMVPLLLVPGAPVTLALRSIRKRSDGSRGPREWIMLIVHSRVANFLTHPLVAAVLFGGSLWAFYYTPLFRWATTNHIGHEWMITHFLITGYLFVQSLIGIDPVKYRLAYPFRLVLLLATMAFHAFFGLALIDSTGLLLANWFGAMGRTWGQSALGDQQTAGGIAWSVGEIPTVILAIVVAMQWSRSDEREAKRRDRHADRTGDAELNEYNARLAGLAAKDKTPN
jgi:cytochrome c oxidase assembly factor CtaG/putative copper export protein